MEEKAGKIVLEVNERKTKYMIKSTSESRRKPQDLKVEGISFMGVSSFRFLGNMINNDNRNDNCVRERIQARNRAYFANLSNIIPRATKLQVYKTLIRTVAATYGAETRTLKVTEKNILRMCERKKMRKIYRPLMENNIWKITQ
jgi:hypothetical protein